jgi:hypothetical protein
MRKMDWMRKRPKRRGEKRESKKRRKRGRKKGKRNASALIRNSHGCGQTASSIHMREYNWTREMERYKSR